MLISVLLTALFLALVQLCIILYVRNVLVSSAAQGARYGANADLKASDGITKTTTLIDTGLPGSIHPTVTGLDPVAGADPAWVEVDVTARIPIFGFLTPAGMTMTVSGHALKEGQ